jgi:EAL domain-containing protein (putative c-di-GMP-specific phosphodiesterase class I)
LHVFVTIMTSGLFSWQQPPASLAALPPCFFFRVHSFTGALEHDPAARSIVRAIIGLGHRLNMPVVTEGVETETQRRIVIEEGCAQLQGIFFGKPDVGPSQFQPILNKAVGQC